MPLDGDTMPLANVNEHPFDALMHPPEAPMPQVKANAHPVDAHSHPTKATTPPANLAEALMPQAKANEHPVDALKHLPGAPMPPAKANAHPIDALTHRRHPRLHTRSPRPQTNPTHLASRPARPRVSQKPRSHPPDGC